MDAERNPFRAQAKQYEAYLNENFSDARTSESRQILNATGQDRNSPIANFLRVLDTDPKSVSVLTDHSRASALAAQFYSAKDKEFLARTAPIRARRKGIHLRFSLLALGLLGAGLYGLFRRPNS